MLRLLQQIETRTSQLNLYIGQLLSWFIVLMVAVVFAVVVMRYGFEYGDIAIQEIATYLHGLAFMLAIAYTLASNEHVRVDIFYRGMDTRCKTYVDLGGTVLLLIPFAGYVLFLSWDYVIQSWSLLEGSREAGGLPFVFLLKSTIPLMALLLLVQSVSIICKSLVTLLSGRY